MVQFIISLVGSARHLQGGLVFTSELDLLLEEILHSNLTQQLVVLGQQAGSLD
jgi:hypothetical protein